MRSHKVSSSLLFILIYFYVSPGSGLGPREQASATNVPWATSLMGFWPGAPVPSTLQSPNNKFMEMYSSIRGSSVTCEYVWCHTVVIVVGCYCLFANGKEAAQVWHFGHSTETARMFLFAAGWWEVLGGMSAFSMVKIWWLSSCFQIVCLCVGDVFLWCFMHRYLILTLEVWVQKGWSTYSIHTNVLYSKITF